MRYQAGDRVQTPLGKGIVSEVRGSRRLVVVIRGQAVVFEEGALRPLDVVPPEHGPATATPRAPASDDNISHRRRAATEVDLHGLTVEEALARAGQALNDAILADIAELRLIHGRRGGRIRAALHRHLRGINAVRGIRLDPLNPGVTIVSL